MVIIDIRKGNALTDADRDRWNKRWASRSSDPNVQSSLLELVTAWVPASGRALDIAGGGSGDAVRLAELGLDVTVVDLSDTGLELTRDLAKTAGLSVRTIRANIETEPLPVGPWNLITVANYLQRSLFSTLTENLAEGGMLAMVLATKTNLERHPLPGAEFLLAPDEILDLADGLDLVHHSEDWRSNGRHEARLVARRH